VWLARFWRGTPTGPTSPPTSGAELTVSDRQVDVVEFIKLRSTDGLPRTVRFRGPAGAAGYRGQPPSTWEGRMGSRRCSGREGVTLKLNYAIAFDRQASEQGQWKVPAGLFLPVDADTDRDHRQRLVNAVTGRTIANLSPPGENCRSSPRQTGTLSLAHNRGMPQRHASPVRGSRDAETSNVVAWIDRR